MCEICGHSEFMHSTSLAGNEVCAHEDCRLGGPWPCGPQVDKEDHVQDGQDHPLLGG